MNDHSNWRSVSVHRINAAYEAPTYEEVMTMSVPAIWTIASNPGSVPSPLSEPPPYNVVIQSIAQGETAVVLPGVSVASNTRSTSKTGRDSRMHLQLVLPPGQQCFVSDINEMKGNADRFEPLEPLTPPPAYENAINDEVFDDAFQPSIVWLIPLSMNAGPNLHLDTLRLSFHSLKQSWTSI